MYGISFNCVALVEGRYEIGGGGEMTSNVAAVSDNVEKLMIWANSPDPNDPDEPLLITLDSHELIGETTDLGGTIVGVCVCPDEMYAYDMYPTAVIIDGIETPEVL